MKRFLVTMGLIVAIAAPTVADAAKPAPQPFAASGGICLTALPDKVKVKVKPKGVVRYMASGEEFAGIIADSSQWASLAGAPLTLSVDRQTARFDVASMTFSGRVQGNVTIANDGDPLTGRFNGTVTGLFFDPTNPVESVYASTADIRFNVRDNNDRARGEGSAVFVADPSAGTYCGPLTLSGSVRPRKNAGGGSSDA